MKRIAVAALSLLVLALGVRAGLTAQTGYDYFGDASSAIDALARGDVHGYLTNQPAMGSLSVLLRAPLVALVYHADLTTIFMAGAVPCVAAGVWLALTLSRRLQEAGASPAAQTVTALLVVVNPITFRALHWGHPEELLTAALCVGAVLAALRDRPVPAGLLLGLALAGKQWAVIAILPTLLAASQRRLVILALGAAIAAALTVPLIVFAPEQASKVAQTTSGIGGGYTTPWNVWWPFAHLVHLAEPIGPRYEVTGLLARISHPIIVLSMVPLSAALWWRRDRRRDDALLLLAVLFLVRCVFDNWNNDYYHVPFVLSLIAWEALRFKRVPVLSLAVTAALGLTFFPDIDQIYRDSASDAGLFNVAYLAWALPLLAGLGAALYRPPLLARVSRRRPARVSLPAGVAAPTG